MELGRFKFPMAIAASLAAHVLLWPASKRIHVSADADTTVASRQNQITFILKPTPLASLVSSKKPRAPEIDTPDDMGEATGTGTGAQAAEGKQKLKAPEADQDQAFLSRDPVGHGHVGDPPAFNTGPRGENGSGGQRGGLTAMPTPSTPGQPSNLLPVPPVPASKEIKPIEALPTPSTVDRQASQQPRPLDAAHTMVNPGQAGTTDSKSSDPKVSPEQSPPLSQAASAGASKADLSKPPADAVKPTGPLTDVASASDGNVSVAPREGPSVTPVAAVGSAPPVPGASSDRQSVALAMQQPQAPSVVSASPPVAAAESAVTPEKRLVSATISPKPRIAPEMSAPSSPLIATGDARAPGRDKPSADPAQESDSESDPFAKTEISAVLHDGRLEVRKGRKIKTTRAHFLPGAQGAFLANPNPVLVLQISIQPDGNVKNVDIVRSTGSIEIDQPCRVAVYDWWFEPAHDKQGRAVSDVVVFTIRFR